MLLLPADVEKMAEPREQREEGAESTAQVMPRAHGPDVDGVETLAMVEGGGGADDGAGVSAAATGPSLFLRVETPDQYRQNRLAMHQVRFDPVEADLQSVSAVSIPVQFTATSHQSVCHTFPNSREQEAVAILHVQDYF